MAAHIEGSGAAEALAGVAPAAAPLHQCIAPWRVPGACERGDVLLLEPGNPAEQAGVWLVAFPGAVATLALREVAFLAGDLVRLSVFDSTWPDAGRHEHMSRAEFMRACAAETGPRFLGRVRGVCKPVAGAVTKLH